MAQRWGFAQGRQDQRILSLLLGMAGPRRVGEGAGEQERMQDQAMLYPCIQNWQLGGTDLCPWSFVNVLLLQSTCPVATTELWCGFLLEPRSFLGVLGKTISAGPGLSGRSQERGVLGGHDNAARPCRIPPGSSLFSHLSSLAPWLLIILADTQQHVSPRISLYCE